DHEDLDRRLAAARLLRGVDWKRQDYVGPLAFLAFDDHGAAEVRNGAIYLAQPQAAALAVVLGGEEWIHRLAQDTGRHAGAVVAHADDDALGAARRGPEPGGDVDAAAFG